MNILKIPFSGTTTFETHGMPDVMITDCSRELTSAEFREAVRAAGKHLVVKPHVCSFTKEEGR